MHEHYGIDLSEPGLLDRRSGRWLAARLSGLLDMGGFVESRLHAALYPSQDGGEP